MNGMEYYKGMVLILLLFTQLIMEKKGMKGTLVWIEELKEKNLV